MMNVLGKFSRQVLIKIVTTMFVLNEKWKFLIQNENNTHRSKVFIVQLGKYYIADSTKTNG